MEYWDGVTLARRRSRVRSPMCRFIFSSVFVPDTDADQAYNYNVENHESIPYAINNNLHHDAFRDNHAIKVDLVFIFDEKITRPRGDSCRKHLGQNLIGQLSAKYTLLARRSVKKTLGGVGRIQVEGAGRGGGE